MIFARPARLAAILSTAVIGWLLWSPADPRALAGPDAAPVYTPGPMLRRFLEGPMAGVEEIVFAVRVPGRDHWYVTFGSYANHHRRRTASIVVMPKAAACAG
jgi:hypothetical protein